MNQHRRLTRRAAGALLAVLLIPGGASAGSPASSGIVIRFDDVALVAYEDAADNLVAVTGPSLELGCLGLGFEEYFTEVQLAATPSTATVLRTTVPDVPLWVYHGGSIGELCDIVVGGGTLALIGSGTAKFTHTDNDLFVSETRTNSFGDAAQGWIVDGAGKARHVTATFRGLVEGNSDGVCLCRVVREDVTLR